LKNFLSNALKFTHRGGVRLRLYHRTGHPEKPICMAVHDSGVGIPPEKHQIVFEAFKQADGSTSRRYGGTGLGLSISRELAHLLGGEITLESQQSGGAVFTLCLPHVFDYSGLPPQQVELEGAAPPVHAEPQPRPVAQHELEPATTGEAPFADHRILLVDDDLRNLLALTPQLEDWGFEVVAAGDGQEALDTLKDDQDFSLVLMDLMMPERDGYDTITEIREKMQLTALTIIAMNYAEAGDDGSRCLQVGADSCLADPTDREALRRVISQYIDVT
jgi:two-component system, chemotaxis family, sensor kinase CheA